MSPEKTQSVESCTSRAPTARQAIARRCGRSAFTSMLVIAWYSWPALVSSWNIGEMSSDHGGLIRWPMRLLIPVAFVLLALQGVSEIIKRCAFLAGRGPNPAEPHKEGA